MSEQDGEFWFNTRTKQVEHGRQSHYTDLMGPSPAEEAARQALDTAAARNEKWDDDDDRWKQG